MKQYRCIKRLVVPELWGYEGLPTGNDFVVEVGEVWNQEEDWLPMLTKDDGRWLDIGKETLKEHFEVLRARNERNN